MTALLHRLLVVVTGQPDSWETRCTGNCNQGRACTCETELACDVAPDAERVIRAPVRTAAEESSFQFWKRWSRLIATASVAFFAALLRVFGAQSL